MALPGQNTEVETDEDELETSGNQGGYAPISANSPYAKQLAGMLDQYSKALETRRTERTAVMKEAEQKLLNRINDPMSQAATYFKIASAFGKPTRTGSFGETLGNVAGAAGEAAEEHVKRTEALEDLRSKYKLAGLDQDVDELGKQIGITSKLAQLGQGKMGEYQQLVQAIQNMKPGDPQRALLEQRLRKLTYIKPSGEGAGGTGGKPQSPLGKIAADEGYTPGTPQFQKRVTQLRAEGAASRLSSKEQTEYFEAEDAVKAGEQLILNLGRALEINDKAYEGFTAGARRTIGRHIPIVKESEGVNASTELENLVGQNAVGSLKTTFGGNPTEGERKIQLDLQGSLSMTAPERKTIWESAIKAANRRIEQSKARMKAIKAGAYSRSEDPEEKARGGRVGYAEGGEVDIDTDEGKAEFFKNAMRTYGPQGQIDSAAAGVTRPVGQGRVTGIASVANNPADAQIMRNFIAQYEHPVAGATVRGTVNKPAGVPVTMGDVSVAVPVGRGQAMAGVMGSRGETGTHRDARMVGYRQPIGREGGGFMATAVRPEYGNTRYNVQAQIPFAKGGRVKKFGRGGGTDTSGDLSLANIGRAVGQGAGFSFGDEAIARVRSQMEGRPYDQVLAEEREAYRKFAERYPYTAMGTELASGLAPTALAMMLPGTQGAGVVGGAQALTRAQKLAQYAKMAGLAGAEGAVSGAGAAEGGLGNRVKGAAETGAMSAVTAPVVSKVLSKAGSAASRLKNAVRPSEDYIDEHAVEKVLQAMGRDDVDIAEAKRRLAKDRQMGVKSTIADVTPSTTSLAEAVVTRPGPGRKKLGKVYEDRLEAGRDTVGNRAFQAVGKGQDYSDREGALVSKLRGNANSAYDAAYAHGTVDDPRILSVLEDPTFKKAYDEAQQIVSKEKRAAQLRGEDTSRFELKPIYHVDGEGNVTRVDLPDVRTLDYIKRGIDAMIDKGYSSTNGMSKAEAGALRDLKKAFVDVIDDATTVNGVSPYKQARMQYAGDREVLDALQFGRTDYLSPKLLPKDAAKMVAGMSDAEKDALRAGVAQSLLTKVTERPQQVNAAQLVIGAPATRQRLETLFDNPAEYKLFEAALERESQLFRNAQDIMRGSRTANKTAALDDLKHGGSMLDVAGEAVDIATAGPGSIMGRLLKALQARTTVDEKTAGKLADMLKAGTPQEIDAVFNEIEQQGSKVLNRAKNVRTAEQATAGTLGASAGSLPSKPAPAEPVAEEDDDAKLKRLMDKYGTGEE